MVLKDLCKKCHKDQPVYVRGDVEHTIYQAAQLDVINHIISRIKAAQHPRPLPRFAE